MMVYDKLEGMVDEETGTRKWSLQSKRGKDKRVRDVLEPLRGTNFRQDISEGYKGEERMDWGRRHLLYY